MVVYLSMQSRSVGQKLGFPDLPLPQHEEQPVLDPFGRTQGFGCEQVSFCVNVNHWRGCLSSVSMWD
jgi:hypothetical protein